MQAVLFDLDDTLLDHAPCRRNAWQALQARYAPLSSATVDQLIQTQSELFQEHRPAILRGEWSPEDSVRVSLGRMGGRFGMHWNADQLAQVMREFVTAYESEWVPVPGVEALLSALAPRVTVGVVTNGVHDSQWAKLEASGLARYVRFMTAPDTAQGALKPDPRIFREALAQAGATAESTVFVGDLWETDIVGAHGAGLRPLWFNPVRHVPPNSDWAHVIDSYKPLEPILNWLFAQDASFRA